ncbi:MAG: hypothetical protein E6K78_12650 [Candidatus Eisenbacteria bacterium]|uniref:Winged helix-turn-helix domain-containing protein n=1 Tax=Eiseniibacteriota bacterium TaxID=2212470 RepID=A0A538TDA7_UNCEI|nr:MAG: hypothetical protein E6K78_12650 [Candidatus Eisenbacteria bacterium]
MSELKAAAQLLSQTRLLTLTGSAGCGKTRLALLLAERVRKGFQGGVWFANLAATDAARVPQVVAAAVQAREAPGKPLIEAVADQIGNKRLLLVMDNCEHVLGACTGLLATLLERCPNLATIATSREWLGAPGEQTLEVPPFSVPDEARAKSVEAIARYEAVALFVERARAVLPEFDLADENASVVAELCRRLDGIPLAIELAAAQLGRTPLETIRARMADRLPTLERGDHDAPARHRTLWTAIQWSYDQLLPEEQQVFRALAVFAEGWSLEAAAAVARPDADDFVTLDLLTRLVDKSMVALAGIPDQGPRYRLLESIRQFALERLDDSDDGTTVGERHREYFLVLAETAAPELRGGSQQASWLRCLETAARGGTRLRAAVGGLALEVLVHPRLPRARAKRVGPGPGAGSREGHHAGARSSMVRIRRPRHVPRAV